jgi:ankyrin repeat protein
MSVREMNDAIRNGDLNTVENCLNKDAELLKYVTTKGTWVCVAAFHNKIEIMKFLVEKGIPVNADWENCEHALENAASNNSFEAAKWLLENGANVEGHAKYDENGYTEKTPPIVDAIDANDGGSVEIVKLLLDHGARTDISWGQYNFSPLQYAGICQNKDVIEILEKATGKTLADVKRELAKNKKSSIKSIEEHLEKHFGSLNQNSLTEVVTDLSFKIHFINDDEKDTIILATSGLSKKAMNVPKGADDFKYAELLFILPNNWPLDEKSLKEKKEQLAN